MVKDGQGIAFAGGKLDRAEARRGDADWLAAMRTDPRSRVLPFAGLNPRLVGERLGWLPWSALPSGLPWVFLGLEGDSACFAVDVTGHDAPEGYSPEDYTDARTAAAILPHDESAIVAQGRSLLDWHARHGFCAVCGARTEMGKGGLQRHCIAEPCGAEHFPRVDPVVIMLATRGDRCLMGRQARFPPGMVSALAGFMEPGETIEEAVRREIHEEAGVPVGAVRYVLSQPWPFPSSLMIGCLAEALDDRIVIDRAELEDARWYSRDAVRAVLAGEPDHDFFVPPPLAVAHHLLRHWIGD